MERGRPVSFIERGDLISNAKGISNECLKLFRLEIILNIGSIIYTETEIETKTHKENETNNETETETDEQHIKQTIKKD